MRIVSGAVTSGGRSISYCSQKSFFFAGSVKENVITDKDYDAERYSSVLNGVCMSQDIQLWPERDAKVIDAHGTGLSGGQKARLNLARALYAKSSIVLLDDPFSSLDKSTRQRIINFIVLVAISEKRIIVVATHSAELLQKCQLILVLEQGRVITQGSFEFLITQGTSSFTKLLSFQNNAPETDTNNSNGKELTRDADSSPDTPKEFCSSGVIDSRIIFLYLRHVGMFMIIMTLTSMASMQLSMMSIDVWIEYWSGHNGMNSNTFVIISCALCSILMGTVAIRACSFAMSTLRAASSVFESLLYGIINSDINFFREFSSGTIVNLLGRDTYTIDDELPFSLNVLLAQLFTLLGGTIIILYSFYLMAAPLLLVTTMFYKLQYFYRMSSREVRRFLAANRSGVYLSLIELLHHGPLIRAECLRIFFLGKFASALNKDLSLTMTANMISYWLSIRMKMLGILLDRLPCS